MTTHRIELPWEVVVPDNRKYGIYNGRPLLTKRYRDAKDLAHTIARASCKGGALAGDVRLSLDVYPPDRRRRDIANLLKLVCDVLSGAAYDDDSQIVMLSAFRHPVAKDAARVVVHIEPAA